MTNKFFTLAERRHAAMLIFREKFPNADSTPDRILISRWSTESHTFLSRHIDTMCERVEAERQLQVAYDIIAQLVGPEDCSLDHEGYCQAHDLTKPCIHPVAKEWLEENKEVETDA